VIGAIMLLVAAVLLPAWARMLAGRAVALSPESRP